MYELEAAVLICTHCNMANLASSLHCAYCKKPLVADAPQPEADLFDLATMPEVAHSSAYGVDAKVTFPTVTALSSTADRHHHASQQRSAPMAVASATVPRTPTRKFDEPHAPGVLPLAEHPGYRPDREQVDFRHAAICSAFIPGSGQVLKGQSEKGFTMLVGFAFLVFILGFWPLTLLLWAANIMDALKTRHDPFGPRAAEALKALLIKHIKLANLN
jgi:hypothetical protein